MRKTAIALMVTTLYLGGCSSSFTEPKQVVDVQTVPASNAACTLQDSKRSYSVNAPGIVEVNQGDGPLKVSCSSATGTGEVVIDESFNTDALWGEKPGMVLDTITGSYQHYPRNITVPINQ